MTITSEQVDSVSKTMSRSRDTVGAHQNSNGSRDLTTPLQRCFTVHGLLHSGAAHFLDLDWLL